MLKKMISCRNGHTALLLMLLMASSCSTPLHKLTYFYGVPVGQVIKNPDLPGEYRLRPNDHIYIRVISDNPENVAFLNLIGSQTSLVGSSYNMELITYLVDESGNISYPFLGKIHVGNKTLEEVQDVLQTEVDKYLINASVFAKLVTRTVTVLGEVKNPGTLTMVKSRMTIFETLGMAGDMTDFGNRTNVKLIREFPEGRVVTQIDLTDPDIIHSPCYYILPHDMIYVERQTKVYGAKNLSYTAPISITASVVSIALLIINLFRL